ncbi:polymer-forming cytoskeletal protein [Pyxidicoccus trucidator]|uniref:polymer-forming cytoskeletal protein n=1 Tax=Pyxidicoccus trucidator TaxID=2709662 RepID=UPI0013D91B19|nr:polymer-forming cytoskeletal protein [Pyxidicoccus trucidator]
MTISSRILVSALLLGAPLALGAEAPTASQAAVTAPASRTIDVSFRGSLRDALKTIADKGGLNLVVTGDLDTPAEVHLRGVTANQALRTVARAYSLRLEQDGSIFTLRPMTAKEQEAAASGDTSATPAPVEAAAPPKVAAAPEAATPPAPPLPAMPPVPPTPGHPSEEDAEAIREAREASQEEMQRASEQMHRTREELRRSRRSGGRNVVARGQSLEVKEGQNVESAVVYGGNLVVKGHVEDDAVAFGGNLEVHGHVEGDAHAFGGNVILGPDAHVEGDVSSFGGTVERADGAEVEGSIETFGGAGIGRMVAGEIKNGMRESRHDERHESSDNDEDGEGLAAFILTFAVLFGLGFLGQMFFPARMKQLGDEIRRKPVQSGLTGLLGLLAMVPLSVVLCITIIGIPAAMVLWMAAPLAAALGYAAVASELGTRLPLLRGRKTQAVVLALGLLVLMVVGIIPVLGFIVTAAIVLMALGAVIRTRFGNIRPSGMPQPIMSSTEQPI